MHEEASYCVGWPVMSELGIHVDGIAQRERLQRLQRLPLRARCVVRKPAGRQTSAAPGLDLHTVTRAMKRCEGEHASVFVATRAGIWPGSAMFWQACRLMRQGGDPLSPLRPSSTLLFFEQPSASSAHRSGHAMLCLASLHHGRVADRRFGFLVISEHKHK